MNLPLLFGGILVVATGVIISARHAVTFRSNDRVPDVPAAQRDSTRRAPEPSWRDESSRMMPTPIESGADLEQTEQRLIDLGLDDATLQSVPDDAFEFEDATLATESEVSESLPEIEATTAVEPAIETAGAAGELTTEKEALEEAPAEAPAAASAPGPTPLPGGAYYPPGEPATRGPYIPPPPVPAPPYIPAPPVPSPPRIP